MAELRRFAFLPAAASMAALALSLVLAALPAHAKEAAPAAQDPQTEERMLRITSELRCLVCQNQTIADSHADLAEDLRQQVREMIRKGATDQQVVDYMTQRYGDFVLYRPPLRSTTWLLWFGPAVLLAVGVGTLAVVLRRRSRLADDRFEPDEDLPDEQLPEGEEGAA